MNDKELIEQLRKGFGTAAGRATQVNFYHMWCQKAADALESLLAENERLKRNLATTEQTAEGRILCERCEAMAVKNGLPSADELAGKHVHKGRTVAVVTCCDSVKEKA